MVGGLEILKVKKESWVVGLGNLSGIWCINSVMKDVLPVLVSPTNMILNISDI